jgi:hypothetical protein
MSGFALLDYDSDSSVDMDEENCESEMEVTPMNSPKRHSIPCLTLGQKGMDIEDSDFEIVTPRNSPKRNPMKHPTFKDLKFHYWQGPKDNELFHTMTETNFEKLQSNDKKFFIKNMPPLVLPDPSVSWFDFQENLEETPGTEEFFYNEERKKRLEKEKIKEEKESIQRLMKLEAEKKQREKERKRIESLSISLAGELYSSTAAIVEQRDEIAKRNKNPFMDSKKPYILLPQKDQDFFWDLIEYHPKVEEKKRVIQSFVYGYVAKRNFSGLLVLQKDGKLDSFSQQKPFKTIAEIFRQRGLGEPDVVQNKKNYNYNNNNRNNNNRNNNNRNNNNKNYNNKNYNNKNYNNKKRFY